MTIIWIVAIVSVMSMQSTNSDIIDKNGNLQPFGSSGTVRKINSIIGFPQSQWFLQTYVNISRPLLMKGVGKLSPAFRYWSDDYLKLKASCHNNMYVWCETQKHEHRLKGPVFKHFALFLAEYNTSDVYIVDKVPGVLMSDVLLPCPIQCKDLHTAFDTHFLWFSSGGTKSTIHVDSYENILCQMRGKKTVTMIDPSIGLHKFPIGKDGSMAVDVDKVNIHKFPVFADIEFIVVNLTAGDCLYIPTHWIHQVNSYGSNIAVNVWWNRQQAMSILDKGACQDTVKCDLSLTLEKVNTWSSDLDEDIDG